MVTILIHSYKSRISISHNVEIAQTQALLSNEVIQQKWHYKCSSSGLVKYQITKLKIVRLSLIFIFFKLLLK
jgi:hypothetical protein